MTPADLSKNKASVFIYDLVSINVCPRIRPFYSQCLLFLDKASVFIYDIISLNMCPRACLSSRIGTSIIVQAQTLKCFLLKWDNEQLVPSGFDGTKVPTYQPSISSTHSYGNTNWAGYRILGSWMMEVAKWSLTKFAKKGRSTTVGKGRQRSSKVGKGRQRSAVCLWSVFLVV